MKIGENIRFYRKQKNLTQEQLAEKVNVSFQTVSAWERDAFLPQLDKAEEIAETLNIPIGSLFKAHEEYDWKYRDQLFDVHHMYRYIRTFAQSSHAVQTAAALPYAKEKHEGVYRKGSGHVPYLYHPLTMACHAIALGLKDDSLIAAVLLHDVCEDCRDENGIRIQPEDLPVGKAAQETVRLVTKPEKKEGKWLQIYYAGISENRDAMLVKVLDRCNNISLMASAFSKEKMAEYILETEQYILPLLTILKSRYEDTCYNAAFLLKYQMLSEMENLKRLL